MVALAMLLLLLCRDVPKEDNEFQHVGVASVVPEEEGCRRCLRMLQLHSLIFYFLPFFYFLPYPPFAFAFRSVTFDGAFWDSPFLSFFDGGAQEVVLGRSRDPSMTAKR